MPAIDIAVGGFNIVLNTGWSICSQQLYMRSSSSWFRSIYIIQSARIVRISCCPQTSLDQGTLAESVEIGIINGCNRLRLPTYICENIYPQGQGLGFGLGFGFWFWLGLGLGLGFGLGLTLYIGDAMWAPEIWKIDFLLSYNVWCQLIIKRN